MHLREIISPERIAPSLPVTSKKRLLEKLSTLLCEDDAGIDANTAFQSLIERERLGTTGIGEGVALPHGRVKGLKKALGAFATLATAMDFDSVDQKPVRIVFALLVPQEATEEHLQILAQLAALFSKADLRKALLRARTAEELYNRLTGDKPA